MLLPASLLTFCLPRDNYLNADGDIEVMVKSYTDANKHYTVVVGPRKIRFMKNKTPFKCFDYICNCDGWKFHKFCNHIGAFLMIYFTD